MTRPARAVIDLGALRHNLDRVRQAAPRARVMAVVKANAYGHGLAGIAAALDRADALAVAGIDEALAVREAGVSGPVVLLEGLFDADELEVALARSFEPVVHRPDQAGMLERAGPGRPLRCWLKIETGMHRLGLAADEFPVVRDRLLASGRVAGAPGLMTHLACADQPDGGAVAAQLARFERLTTGLDGARSIANSAAILAHPASHGDWVRPGLMLYGASPFPDRDAGALGLRPVMRLESALIAVKRCRAGDRVGYGGAFECPQDMPVGIVGIGYGDGYPRDVRPGTPVLVDGVQAPLVGRVSMDMLGVDLRGAPSAGPGAPVTLWGPGLPVERIAAAAGTIPYVLLCGVAARVPRVPLDVESDGTV